MESTQIERFPASALGVKGGFAFRWLEGLTQVIMEKKEKAIAARAASAPWLSGSSSALVRDH